MPQTLMLNEMQIQLLNLEQGDVILKKFTKITFVSSTCLTFKYKSLIFNTSCGKVCFKKKKKLRCGPKMLITTL